MSSKRFRSPQSSALPVKRKSAVTPSDERQFVDVTNSKSTLFSFFKKSSRHTDDQESSLASERRASDRKDRAEASLSLKLAPLSMHATVDYEKCVVAENLLSMDSKRKSDDDDFTATSPDDKVMDIFDSPVQSNRTEHLLSDQNLNCREPYCEGDDLRLLDILESSRPDRANPASVKRASRTSESMKNAEAETALKSSTRRFGKVVSTASILACNLAYTPRARRVTPQVASPPPAFDPSFFQRAPCRLRPSSSEPPADG